MVHLLHTIQSNRKQKNAEICGNDFIDFFEEHKKEFKTVYDMLEDEFSKKTYKNVIYYRKTFKITYLNEILVFPQYFQNDIFMPEDNECFVDGGAYIGDTAEAFIRYYKGKKGCKLYLWECDRGNIEQIKKNVKDKSDYEILPYAMWSEGKEIAFIEDGTSLARVGEGGNATVEAKTIDEVHKNDRVTFIKMDIEGAEIEALKGAEKTIKRCKPKLAICIYHEPDHLYRIPLMIKEMVPEYKFYVRQHSDTDSETVLYAKVQKCVSKYKKN